MAPKNVKHCATWWDKQKIKRKTENTEVYSVKYYTRRLKEENKKEAKKQEKTEERKITVKKVAEEYMRHSARQEGGRSTAKRQHKAKGAGETSP